MEDTLIEYNTAVLAKEKGFNEPTINHWERGIDNAGWGLFNSPGFILKNDQLTSTYINEANDEICGEFSAPTQSLLAKWLREEHNIEVGVMRYTYSGGIYQGRKYMWYVDQYDPKYNHEIEDDDNYWILNERQSQGYEFNIFEQAYEKGLQEALKLVK